ncbi:Chaperone Hsp70 family protein [Desulfonema limicola]|uniref:Chaperone Hsp70 family protein n=1 Tax=Desulfonema limicola TaxID=45656 RepID=A0A975B4M9_9BACT|nr:Hsp70 family protein [Desulfonema limicola]QTA78706.1 Chaperone Hsp70 family protein [Desulfonema limicola]
MKNDIPILGIDLGTTNSAISIWDPEKKQAVLLPNQENSLLTPSVVAFDSKSDKPLVGSIATEMILTMPEDVIHSVKRFIGLSYRDKQVSDSKSQVEYRIEPTDQEKVIIRLADRVLTPPQISKYVLEKLKKDAETYLNREVNDVVITVPAYFSESQRHATIDAGKRAGLNVKRLINEPTAAALAFDFGKEAQTIVVYDLGGGTFDVSVIEITRTGMYRVLAIDGNTHLGGDDFDEKVFNWIKEQIREKYDSQLVTDAFQEAMLREKARQAKIELTDKMETIIKLTDLRLAEDSAFNLSLTLTRDTFNTLIQSLIEDTIDLCDSTLAMAHEKTGVSASDIRQVLLVGGQTQSPAVKDAINKKYNWVFNNSIDPANAVCMGAAVFGGFLSEDRYLNKRIRLSDVIAQPLGIEIKGGNMKEIIKANQRIPYDTEDTPEEYTTHEDNQGMIEFRIYQGSNPIASKNVYLGTVPLTITNPGPKGEVRVKCWFEIGWDGFLKVHTKAINTTDKKTIKIDYFYYLDQERADELE